jgi:hypothetical protein
MISVWLLKDENHIYWLVFAVCTSSDDQEATVDIRNHHVGVDRQLGLKTEFLAVVEQR